MAGSVDGGDARHDLVSGRYECRAVGKADADTQEQVAIAQPGFAHRLCLGPEDEFCRTEDIARSAEDGFALVHEATDVVGVAMRDDHQIDVAGLEPKVLQALQQ